MRMFRKEMHTGHPISNRIVYVRVCLQSLLLFAKDPALAGNFFLI